MGILQHFLTHIEEHQHRIIYTSESKIEGNYVRFIVIFKNKMKIANIPNEVSTYTDKLRAMKLTLNKMHNKDSKD